MTRRCAWIGLVVVACLALAPASGSAQEVIAEVKTWSGQSWRLTQPTLELFFTIVPPPKERGGMLSVQLPLSMPGAAPSGSSGGGRAALPGFLEPLGPAEAPEPTPGVRRADFVALFRDGVEIRVPLASIASLHFSRQPIAGSQLPPYVASTHFRYAATAALVDGSRVEGDYVNLGAAVVRGFTPQGRVEIPWVEVESIRFDRVRSARDPEPKAPPAPVYEAPAAPARRAVATPLRDVFFAFDKYDLTDAAKAVLDENARWLTAHPEIRIMVEGHADERGTNEYNLALGERRAHAVRDYLIAQGIDPSRIETISYSEERPFVLGRDESAWRQNRRAHFLATR